MRRFWIRWTQPTEDERPITFPPNEAILGWWRTGYTCDHTQDLPVVPILCALVEADNQDKAIAAIKQEWPEAEMPPDDLAVWGLVQVELDWLPPRDRFPPSQWMSLRLCRIIPPIAEGAQRVEGPRKK